MKDFFNKIKSFISNHKKLTVALSIAFVLIVTTGIYLYLANRVPLKFLSSLSDDQQVGIGRFIGNAYQHIYGYKTVCKTADVVLTKYPETYRNIAKENLELLNKILTKDDLNLEAAIYLFMPYENLQAVNASLYKELLAVAGGDKNAIKNACILLEEQADLIISGMTKDSAKEFNEILRSALN